MTSDMAQLFLLLQEKIGDFVSEDDVFANGTAFENDLNSNLQKFITYSDVEKLKEARATIKNILRIFKLSRNADTANKSFVVLFENLEAQKPLLTLFASPFVLGVTAYIHHCSREFNLAQTDLYKAIEINDKLETEYPTGLFHLHSLQLINNLQKVYFCSGKFKKFNEISTNTLNFLMCENRLIIKESQLSIEIPRLMQNHINYRRVMFAQIFADFAECLCTVGEDKYLCRLNRDFSDGFRADHNVVHDYIKMYTEVVSDEIFITRLKTAINSNYYGALKKLAVHLLFLVREKAKITDKLLDNHLINSFLFKKELYARLY